MADRCVETRGCREGQRLVQRTSQCPPCDRRKTTRAVRTSKIDYHDCTKRSRCSLCGEAHEIFWLRDRTTNHCFSKSRAVESSPFCDSSHQISHRTRSNSRTRACRWKASDGENGAFLWYFGLLCVEPKSPRQRPSRHSVLRHLK